MMTKKDNRNKLNKQDVTDGDESGLVVSCVAALLFAPFGGYLIWSVLYAMLWSPHPSVSGWPFIFAVWIGFWPLVISTIWSIMAIRKYSKSSKPKTKVRKVFHVLNCVSLLTLAMIPLLFVLMYLMYIVDN